jgi:nitroreductase
VRFLATRRSFPAKTLRRDGPSRTALEALLQSALRAPDHGKLTPWRLFVVEGAARERLGALARPGARRWASTPDKVEKAAGAFAQGAVLVAVAATPQPSEKIPDWEQTLSAGCVCYGLLNAALAAGWGANWLTGFTATDRPFLQEAFGLEDPAFIVGYVHIGAPGAPTVERPRPALDEVVRWMEG